MALQPEIREGKALHNATCQGEDRQGGFRPSDGQLLLRKQEVMEGCRQILDGVLTTYVLRDGSEHKIDGVR